VEGDEEDGAEMDDLDEEFPAVAKSPKKPHEPVAFDVYSENGEQPPQRWRTGGQTLSSFTGSGECFCHQCSGQTLLFSPAVCSV
jgi:cellulose synthase A